jgi:hypothetical protein
MLEKLKESPAIASAKETHQAALAKEKHMNKLKSALRISDDYKPGEAFDMEL